MNIKQSEFQFQNPVLDECFFWDNKDYNDSTPVEMCISMSGLVDKSEQLPKARISLTVEIGQKSNGYPFYLKVTMGAGFKWTPESFDDKMLNDLVNVNAPTLLLSYIRPFVASFTAATRHSTFHIPYVDMRKMLCDTHEAEEKDEKSTEEQPNA